MTGVRRVPVGKVLELQRRAVDVTPEERYREIGVRSFARGLFLKDPVSGHELGAKRVFHVEPGDLVVSNIFAWEGAVAVATDEHAGTIGSHRFMTWTTLGDVDVDFLAHYFASDQGLNQLRAASPGSAGRNRTLSIKNFEAIEIPLPDLPEQRRIATHLDRVAAVESSTRASGAGARAKVDASRRSLWRRFEAPSVAVNAILELSRTEISPLDDEVYRRIGIFSWGKGFLHRPAAPASELGSLKYFTFEVPSLILSNIQAWEGAVAVASESERGMIASNRFLPYTPIGSVDVDLGYLKHYFVSERGLADLQKASPGTQVRNRTLGKQLFENLRIPLPEFDLQRRIAAHLDGVASLQMELDRRALLAEALLASARNRVFNSLR